MHRYPLSRAPCKAALFLEAWAGWPAVLMPKVRGTEQNYPSSCELFIISRKFTWGCLPASPGHCVGHRAAWEPSFCPGCTSVSGLRGGSRGPEPCSLGTDFTDNFSCALRVSCPLTGCLWHRCATRSTLEWQREGRRRERGAGEKNLAAWREQSSLPIC